MKTFECPGNKKPREISKRKRNPTDSYFVAGPVRETIIAFLSICFPPKYYQSFPLKSRFYSLNNKSLMTRQTFIWQVRRSRATGV